MLGGHSRGDRRGRGLWAWVSLAVLATLLLCVALGLTRIGPRPFVTQAQIEQQGTRDALSRGIGRVQRIDAYSTTLGHLRPNLNCPFTEQLGRALRVAARIDTYNACDLTTRLWVVELWGEYPLWVVEPVRMLYTAAGDFIRSEGGP